MNEVPIIFVVVYIFPSPSKLWVLWFNYIKKKKLSLPVEEFSFIALERHQCDSDESFSMPGSHS